MAAPPPTNQANRNQPYQNQPQQPNPPVPPILAYVAVLAVPLMVVATEALHYRSEAGANAHWLDKAASSVVVWGSLGFVAANILKHLGMFADVRNRQPNRP